MAISFATEAGKAPSYPNTRLNARERKVCEVAKAYIDTQDTATAAAAQAASVSNAAYGAGWDNVTTVAPSKNAVYDIVQTKQNVISMGQAANNGSGEISVAGMTATGKIIVCPAEDLGAGIVFSHVVADVDKVVVYVKDVTDETAAAAVFTSAKLWNLLVIALS